MFRFANPEYLWLLVLVPAFTAIYVLMRYKQKQRLRVFGEEPLLKGLIIGLSGTRRTVKFILLMLALTAFAFLLARPQYGTRNEEVKRQGIEVMIAVDVSNSMLCRDITPSRLDRAKMLVSKLVDHLGENKIGLVAFAGSAITLLPSTVDGAAVKMFLDQLTPATINVQGTDVGQAISRSLLGFSDNDNIGKALLLITDAEDHEQAALDAAKEAKQKGVHVFVLSVGTEAGGPIPMGNGAYKKDSNGNIVTTKLNPEVGKQIAQAGDGIYLNIDQTNNAQDVLKKELDKMQKTDFAASMFAQYDEQFIGVAILLLVFLFLEMCITEKTNPLFKHIKIFK